MIPDDAKVVYLSTLNGFNFEDLCASILRRLGWGEVTVTPKVRDGGRDMIITRQNSDIVLVECKHQPKTSIGRPVIQKLHSAVISAGAKKGIVITTGRFTRDAIQHAKTLNLEIELIDLMGITEMAENAGIKLVSEGHTYKHYFRRYASDLELERAQYSLINHVESYPKKIEEVISFSTVEKGFLPVYSINYSINQTFSTTVGVLHSVDVSNRTLLLKGPSGTDPEPSIINLILSDGAFGFSNVSELPETTRDADSTNGGMDLVSLGNLAKKNIAAKYTKTVRYVGGNNVKYQKECIPSSSNIMLGEIVQFFLRYRVVRMRQSSYAKELVSIDTEEGVLLDHEVPLCDYCGGRKRLMVCNDCSLFFDYGFRKHGKKCSGCGKTVCVNCMHRHRWPSFIRGYICKTCSVKLYGESDSGRRKLRRVPRPVYWESVKERPDFKVR